MKKLLVLIVCFALTPTAFAKAKTQDDINQKILNKALRDTTALENGDFTKLDAALKETGYDANQDVIDGLLLGVVNAFPVNPTFKNQPDYTKLVLHLIQDYKANPNHRWEAKNMKKHPGDFFYTTMTAAVDQVNPRLMTTLIANGGDAKATYCNDVSFWGWVVSEGNRGVNHGTLVDLAQNQDVDMGFGGTQPYTSLENGSEVLKILTDNGAHAGDGIKYNKTCADPQPLPLDSALVEAHPQKPSTPATAIAVPPSDRAAAQAAITNQ
jgi:hypothetical protein